MTDKKKDPDPFPQLPRRPMFTGMGVQPEDAPGFQPLEVPPAEALVNTEKVIEVTHVATFSVPVAPLAVPEVVQPKRTGRPPKHPETKPWVAEGISRALWYRRQKKAGK